MEVTKAPQKKKQLIPKLRFKEFGGEWSSQKLSDFITFISGYAFNSAEMRSTESKYQLIKMSNVYKSELQLDRSPSYWDEIDTRTEKFLLRKKDILLTLTGTVGKRDYGYSVVIPEGDRFLLNQRLVCLRYMPNISAGDFINSLIKTSHFLYFFFGESKGGTGNQTNVGIEDLRNIKLNIPALPEQQKIASFLSAIDEKTQQLTRKKELLEQYKKGVMQQLFSGKLRFKDENGKAYPKWEEKRFGDFAERVTRKNKENNQNVLTISAQNGLVSQLEYFNKSVAAKDVTNYYLLEKDEFAYNKSYSNGYPMGAIKRLLHYDKGVVSTLYICFRFKDNASFSFMEQYFENGYQNNEIEKVAQEGARNHGLLNIGVTDFFNIKLTMPSYAEQQKIATYLSSLDEKIESVTTQITQTQTFKKGLLQQMFV